MAKKCLASTRKDAARCSSWRLASATIRPMAGCGLRILSLAHLHPELESLQNSRVLLIKVLKDHEPLEMSVGTLDGLEKIMEI